MGRDHRVRSGPPLLKHIQHLQDRLADVARDISLLKSRLRSPTNPVYDPDFPLDAVDGQFALHGGLPYYYWDGAWHIFAGANVWVYFGTFGVDPLTTADSIPYDAPWINTGSMATPVEPLRFRLSPDLNLELEGSFTGGVSGQPLGTLAVPWRPDYEKWFVIVAQQPGGSVIPYAIQVATTGVLTPYELLTAGPTGADGVDGVSIHVGAGVPANSLGSDGDLDINSTNGDYYLKVAGVYVLQGNLTGPAGAAGAPGGAGAAGAAGANGTDGGLKYTYSTDTAASDPTSGKLKFDDVTLSAITSLRISETDGDGNSIASLIQSWDDSTSGARATVTIVKQGAPNDILVFQITGAITDNGTWDSGAVAFVASSGSFANGDIVRVFVSRTGDKGDTGAAGAAGGAGSPGAPEVAYNEFTSDVTITATSTAGANTVVTASAFTADGVSAYLIEFFSGFVVQGSTNVALSVDLFVDGSFVTSLCFLDVAGGAPYVGPMFLARRLVLASGSRTISIRAHHGAGGANATIGGRTDTVVPPGFVRVTKVT